MSNITPLGLVLNAFETFYSSQYKEVLSMPKKEKGSDWWAEAWYQFLDKEGIETFLPYLFHIGYLDKTIWQAYQKNGNLPFHQIQDLAGDGIDWLETAIHQPHWALDYRHLEKGADLEEFLDCIIKQFEGHYLQEALEPKYWISHYLYDKEEALELFEDFGNMGRLNLEMEYIARGQYAPNEIKHLKPYQVFVFGSNTEGKHGAGAAAQARRWGAVQGQSQGHMGKTYAIITKDLKGGKRSVPLPKIQEQIKEMLDYALKHPELDFLVTAIGCGLGGYSTNEIAKLFPQELPANVLLPKIFGIPNPNWKKKKEAVLKQLKFEKADSTSKGVLGKSDRPWM